jgi:hypothetical protein
MMSISLARLAKQMMLPCWMDVATVTSKEEVIGVEGKPPAKEKNLLVYPFLGGQAIEESAKAFSNLKRNGTVIQCC